MNIKNTHIVGIVVLLSIGLAFWVFVSFSEKDESNYQPALVASTTAVTASSSSVVSVVVSTTTVTTVTKTVSTPVVTKTPTPKSSPVVVLPPQPIIIQPTVVSSTTVLIIKPIALLSGGTASAGVSIPIAYLQVINNGTGTTSLTGFWLEQNGSASTDVIIGLTVIDDKGTFRGSVGGTENTKPFDDEVAFVPVGVIFAPYEMKLFTIKAIMTSDISDHISEDIKIDVSSVEASNNVRAVFPIRGTTWVINK